MSRNITDAFRIGKLINLYLKQELTAQQQEELQQWVHESPANEELFRELTCEDTQAAELAKLEQYSDDATQQQVLARILQSGKKRRGAVRLWPYVAAASIALLLIATAIIILTGRRQHIQPAGSSLVQQDVPPGGNKAVLTLSNGRKIILDSNANGLLAQQGNMQVINLSGGQLAYQGNNNSNPATEEASFNTLTTPRGGQYEVTLPDGSKVWLNAASSLRYPTSFFGKQRRVTLSGEAYFAVVHNSSKPFIVTVNGTDIKDVGTEFNVKAYDDGQEGIMATVVKGAVSVSDNKNGVLLTAGNQAQISAGSGIKVSPVPDIKKVIAWKNGLFWFDEESITTVMRQIARWYNVDVVYQGNITARFSGSIHRDVNVSVVFKVLEETGGVHFKIEGRRIIVMP